MKWYLAGPMSGIPQFNFPAFHAAAKSLREQGFEIISPAEMDAESDVAAKALASKSGDLIDAGIKETWGDLLARDVKLIADGVGGIVLLENWHKSRGARLESYVALLCGHKFASYSKAVGVVPFTTEEISEWLSELILEGIPNDS